ncbi:hypothetical protein OHA00_33430 (plasmid) [Streptomyces cellulosae]|jgi:hypothetical protein|nr:hypothetical protein OHA00_33470 [Streptomyces cellulosae]WSB52271.1 hypothetical protein OHA00_33430 [Streptomyces cellulosae]
MPSTNRTLLITVAAIGAAVVGLAVVVAPALLPVLGVSLTAFAALLLVLEA